MKPAGVHHSPRRTVLRGLARGVLVLGAVFLLSACALTRLNDARRQFYDGRYENAAATLAETEGSSRDRLLFLMEKGTILHQLGRYEESTGQFLQAARLIEEQDIISLSQQAGSLVTSEWVTEYKGEYSERLWVHTYLMMNFLLLGQGDSAYVEARQALKIMDRHREPLNNDFFSRALIALSFENAGEFNDAYIEYKKLATLLPDPRPVAAELYRLGRRLGFRDEIDRYEQYLPPGWLQGPGGQRGGELVLFVATGRAPVKMAGNILLPPTIRISFPRYERLAAPEPRVSFPDESKVMPVGIGTDVGAVARAALDARAKEFIAKETVRVGAKEALARAVEQNDELAGALLRGFFFLTEEADIRCWHTLPARFTLVRLPLAPGRHDLRVSLHSGGPLDSVALPEFSLAPGGRFFHAVRR